MYNLTNNQKDLVKWLVRTVREGKLTEEFIIYWDHSYSSGESSRKPTIMNYSGSEEELPEITQGALDSLRANELIWCDT